MALKLTPEDLAKLRDKELANAIRKLGDGKTLTARESAMLAQAGVGSTAAAPSAGYAGNWTDLAEALGCSRKALQLWRDDPRYGRDCPPDRPDGRKEVAKWIEWMVRHGLNHADEFITTPGSGDPQVSPSPSLQVCFPPGCEADWKKKLLEQKVAREQRENAKAAGELLVAAELEGPLGATLVAVTNKLTSFPERVAPLVTGFSDVLEVIEILRAEIEADLTILHAADYLADVEQLAGDVPEEQRPQVIECVRQILRTIGRRGIDAALSPAIPSASDPIGDAVPPSDPGTSRSFHVSDFSGHTTGTRSNRGKPCKDRRRGTPPPRRRTKKPRTGKK